MLTWIFESSRPYIKEHQQERIRSYKYNGVNKSIVYNHVISPICNQVAKLLPLWLAPNLITILGFLCNLIPFTLMLLLFPQDFHGPVPSWFSYLMFFSFFAYSILDNTDGKQARRTNSSSPLGMLLDHGIDAVLCAIINPIMIFKVVQVGNSIKTFIALAVVIAPLYFFTMEFYYTGELVLTEINAVDEGAIFYYLFCIIAGYYGNNIFVEKFEVMGFETDLQDCILWSLIAMAIFTGIGNLFNIYRKRHYTHFKKIFKKRYFFIHMLFFPIHTTIYFFACYYSPTNIMKHYSKTVIISYSSILLLIVHRVQYAGVAQERFNPFRRTCLLAWGLLLSQIIHTLYFREMIFNDIYIHIFISITNSISAIHQVYYVIYELKEILNIHLTIITRPLREIKKD